jgi:hypothetical protein
LETLTGLPSEAAQRQAAIAQQLEDDNMPPHVQVPAGNAPWIAVTANLRNHAKLTRQVRSKK